MVNRSVAIRHSQFAIHPMPRQTISLNDTAWQFGQVERQSFAASKLFDLPAVTEWLPATVPGNVRTDLLALGRIPDPFLAAGYRNSLWVEETDWWYHRTVQTGAFGPPQRAFLRFHGIDYLSAIFINRQEIARHEGMFSRQTLEITEALRTGPVDIAVRLWGSSALPRRRLSPVQKLWQKLDQALYRSWVGIYADRTATLKCQMSFGWDFAPPIRTIGIWDDVELLVTGPVFVEELGVSSQGAGGRKKPATCNLQLVLNSAYSTAVTAAVNLAPANFQGDAFGPIQFPLHLPAGQCDVSLRCPLPPVEIWQPWDRGFPHLYNVTVTLSDPTGELLDSLTLRTGFRTVTQAAQSSTNNLTSQPARPSSHPSHSPWPLTLNGQPIFLRGLNWVPADSFPGRLRHADYERLLHMARAANANMLRVWGGGLREKRAFYDLCDELGLLVWQEFPFACEFLGAFPRDAEYLALVERECSDIVRQVRHHPSVALWCGGNEFSRSRNRPLLRTLARVVQREDGTRPFIPTSPGPGDNHNWHVWHGLAPLSAYQQETAPMLSEFGLQSLPDSIENENLEMGQIQARHGDPRKLARYASLFNENLEIKNRKTTSSRLVIHNSQSAIHNSQLAQAVGLQTAIEQMRRRSAEAGGVAVWQFNEPWPAISWAIVAYGGQPKLAFEHLKTWYAPLLVSLEFPVGRQWQPGNDFTATIWLINDSPKSYPPCDLEINLSTIHNSSFTIHKSQFVIPLNYTAPVGHFHHRFAAPPHSLTATLRHGSNILCENSYPLHWHDGSRANPAYRLRRWLADWVLR